MGGGVVISPSSQVNIIGCNIHDNKDVGVLADSNSAVIIRRSTIQNNTPGDGLDVTNDSSADVGNSTIQNNGNSAAGGIGVFVTNHSSVIFRQQNFILNNADVGIQAQDLSRIGFQTGVAGRFSTVQGHNADGIVLAAQSLLRMGGVSPHVIQGNGSACPNDPTCGGIFATRNSTVRIGSGTITGNQGNGISVEEGINVGLSDVTISNNSGDGVRLRRISIGDFIAGNTIKDNGGESISCDRTSLVVGDISTIEDVACKQIERPAGSEHSEKEMEPRQ